MGRILRGILSIVVLGALLGGAWFGWESWRMDKARSALTEVVQSTDLDALLRGEEPANGKPAADSLGQPPADLSGNVSGDVSGDALGQAQGGPLEEMTPANAPLLDPAAESTTLPSAPHTADSPAPTETIGETTAGTVTPPVGMPPADTAASATTLNPVDLALRNILLSQGEQGLELWRLQANWATLRQESGLVEVRDPHVRYALGTPKGERDGKPYFDDEQFVTVTSRTGKVTDNNSRITLEGNVRSEYQGDVITGPVAEFDNTSRALLYTDGATLEGVRLNGFAQVLRWNMETNTLEGEQGVTLIWSPEPKAVESAPNPAPNPAMTPALNPAPNPAPTANPPLIPNATVSPSPTVAK